jgi:hypothetical protein
MDNPGKQTGNLGYTRRNIKQSKNIAQYVLDTTIRKQTQITQIRQLELNANRTSFFCGYRNRHHNTELWASRHNIGQHKKLILNLISTFLSRKHWGNGMTIFYLPKHNYRNHQNERIWYEKHTEYLLP